jgi:Tfp pilus assembly protein PilF
MNILNRKIPAYWILGGCFAIAFILYGNTIRNRYCLDDAIVITQNKFTQKGLGGVKDIFATESFTGFFGEQKQLVAGARYRPFSIATFAIEKEFFGKNPHISHFINILLYALTAFFLYLILLFVFQEKQERKSFIPLLAAVLFLFHPIHTEAVANIKGRDEILALLCSFIACYLVLKNQNKWIYSVFGGLIWLMALLSKENAIVFIVIMPILLYNSGFRVSKMYIKPLFSFTVAVGLFFVIRYKVLGDMFVSASTELLNNSYLDATVNQKFATIFYVLGKYLQLLIFPHPLTFDYYPYHIQLTGWGNFMSVFALVFYLFLSIAFFLWLKKKAKVSLSIAFYLLPLLPVINLFFPIGTFMSERFLYFSSVGFSIILAIIVAYLYTNLAKARPVLVVGFSLLIILYGFKSINRNTAWYNDYTLFTTDVKTSVNSAKSNCSAGGALYESSDTIKNSEAKQRTLLQSIAYLQKSLQIHPKYMDAWLLLGNAYFKLGNNYDSAIYCYTSILQMNSSHNLAKANLLAVAQSVKDFDIRIRAYNTILLYEPENFLANYKLGNLYGKEMNDIDNAMQYLRKAYQINPNSKDVCIDLGVAYGLRKEFALSAQMLENAYRLDRSDANVCINLGLTYQFMGNTNKAKEFFARADSLRQAH